MRASWLRRGDTRVGSAAFFLRAMCCIRCVGATPCTCFAKQTWFLSLIDGLQIAYFVSFSFGKQVLPPKMSGRCVLLASLNSQVCRWEAAVGCS